MVGFVFFRVTLKVLFLFVFMQNLVFDDFGFVGLAEYDPDGRKARILERAIGIKVIRHSKLLLFMHMLFSTLSFPHLYDGVWLGHNSHVS